MFLYTDIYEFACFHLSIGGETVFLLVSHYSPYRGFFLAA